jgi:hypothetical protein
VYFNIFLIFRASDYYGTKGDNIKYEAGTAEYIGVNKISGVLSDKKNVQSVIGKQSGYRLMSRTMRGTQHSPQSIDQSFITLQIATRVFRLNKNIRGEQAWQIYRFIWSSI